MNEMPKATRKEYAGQTKMTAERTRSQIQSLLVKSGATHFAYSMEPGHEVIGFVLHDRRIKLVLPSPRRDDPRVVYTDKGKFMRTPKDADKMFAQLGMSRWRALYLIIKAKIEAVELGITTFEDEFLANTVMPNLQTVSEVIQPIVAEALATGRMPTALPTEGEKREALTASFTER